MLPLALCERFPVLINLRAALNSRVQRTDETPDARTDDATVANMRSAVRRKSRAFNERPCSRESTTC